jgi:tetratricopeptide (TPR) repeat protein
MKPYQEMLEGGYHLVRIRNLKRVIFLFVLILMVVGWAFIWWSGNVGFKPLYAPLDAVFPWLMIMLLAMVATSISFRDLEIKYAKRDGQKFLMANNSQKRAIWTVIVATTLMVILLLPPTSDFVSGELSQTRTGRVASGNMTIISDFSNQDFLGLSKVQWFKITNVLSSNANLRVRVFMDGSRVAEQNLQPDHFLQNTGYNEGDAIHTFNMTLENMGAGSADYELIIHVRMSSVLTLWVPVIMVFFIGLSAAWVIHLMPIKKKYASASIYSFEYDQEVDKGEQVYSRYDVRSKAEGASDAGDLPPPPEMAPDLPPPPVPGAETPPPPVDHVLFLPGAGPQIERSAPPEPAREFDIFIEDGSKCFTNGDLEGALKNFDAALALEPSNITAMLAKGAVLVRLAKEKEALDVFNKVLAVESHNEKALHSKSRLLIDLQQWSDAARTLDAYLQLNPADVDALGWKGDVLMAMGRRNDAALTYETALNLQPDNAGLKTKLERARLDVPSILSRAMVSTASGNYDGALALYEEILRYEPSNTRALAGKAGVLRRLGRREEAIAALDAVLSIEQYNPSALLERAKLHLEEGHLTEALDSAEKFIEVSPADVRGLIMKGDTLGEMDRFDEARVAYKQALTIEMDNPEAKGRLDHLDARIAGIAQGLLSRELDEVKGIGPAKIRALYEAGLKTVDDLRKATADELSLVKGISKKLAEDIVQHFKGPPAEGTPPQAPPA